MSSAIRYIMVLRGGNTSIAIRGDVHAELRALKVSLGLKSLDDVIMILLRERQKYLELLLSRRTDDTECIEVLD